ncbi:unnamed protein product [Closterium sp. NIES-53]
MAVAYDGGVVLGADTRVEAVPSLVVRSLVRSSVRSFPSFRSFVLSSCHGSFHLSFSGLLIPSSPAFSSPSPVPSHLASPAASRGTYISNTASEKITALTDYESTRNLTFICCQFIYLCLPAASPGTYISNRASEKITALTDFAYLCRSGSAADTQTVSTYAQYYLSQHQMELGKPTDVKTVANVVKQISYSNKNMLSAGMIVGGWDQYDGASVYALPQGGTLLKAPFAIGGSGSSYLFAFCDATFKEGMSKEEAEAFVVKAVSLAMARDGASGGCVRTVTVGVLPQAACACIFVIPDPTHKEFCEDGGMGPVRTHIYKFHPGDKLELLTVFGDKILAPFPHRSPHSS